MAANVYRGALTKAELISAATVALIVGQFVRLGQYVVQAGEVISPGFAGQTGQDSAQGRLYVDLKDSQAGGVALNGTLRLSVFSPQDRPLEIFYEWRTETLRTSATDRTLQIPLPELDAWISEDKKLVLEFKADNAAFPVSQVNSTIIMDCTRGTV